jgi:signal peptide peptidase SppA
MTDRPCKPCFTNHMGAWAIMPSVLESAVAAYIDGRLPLAYAEGEKPDGNTTPYAVEDGVAIISIDGPMMKGASKFGGNSTLHTRQRIREAMGDDAVKAALIRVDSPGGHVAGTQELFQDIRRLAHNKPTHAFIEDLGASAGYWAAAGASSISANEMAQVGSIGVYALLVDDSGAMDKRGIKVHKVATGDLKGGATRGVSVTDDIREEAVRMVNAMGAAFFSAVRQQRTITDDNWEAISRGGIFTAREAVANGLIDRVESIDEAFASLRDKAKAQRARQNVMRGF